MDAKQIAQEAKQFFGNACSEMAHAEFDWKTGKLSEWATEENREKVKKAKKAGVTDLQGWLADELYNDPAYLDMVADHIGDMSMTHDVSKHEIWIEFKKIIHSKLHAECDNWIERYKNEESK